MKSYILAVALSSALVAGPVMADNDFQALSKMSGATPMTEGQLAAVEGGHVNRGGGSCSGFANLCLNIAIPTVVGINVGVFSKHTNQTIVQTTTQSIR
ncbi:hypothetical protein [Methylocaldum szegediense]|jgi:hypothetical protein|uniref:Secreted protein n=1 Tax=Methylocaldum szegediense TaxID=73780 RepID=A0ABM9I1Y5_9GAMM|nr:hypothetical protein [Methylocaldum szegediense]CAI8838298.1 conserved exported protein of unknown function [Methylocaldum szegediense]